MGESGRNFLSENVDIHSIVLKLRIRQSSLATLELEGCECGKGESNQRFMNSSPHTGQLSWNCNARSPCSKRP